jgi:uncharacterized protein YqfB (UPF0267 family)
VGHIKCGPRKQVRIKVLAMELMELSEVTGKVLKSEGVSSKTELIKILKNCYPNQVISKLWLISFRKLKDA